MGKLRVFLLVLSIMFTVAGSANANNSCPSSLGAIENSSENKSVEPKTTLRLVAINFTSEENTKDAVVELLRMTGQLRKHSEGNDRRGEFRLGQKLSQNLSLEFEYDLDERDFQIIYRLSKISLVRGDGHTEELSKRPLDPSGQYLAQETLSFEGNLPEMEIKVPIQIGGKVFEAFKAWMPRLPFLKANELRTLTEPSDLRMLYFRFFGRDQKDLHNERFRKEYSKLIFIFLTVFGLNRLTTLIKNKMSNKDYRYTELMEILATAVRPWISGGTAVDQQLSRLQRDHGSTFDSQVLEPHSNFKRTRMFTVSVYEGAQVIYVTDQVLSEGRLQDIRGLEVPKNTEPQLFEKLRKWALQP